MQDALTLRWRVIVTDAFDGTLRAERAIPRALVHATRSVRAFAAHGGVTDVTHPAMPVYGAAAVVTGWALGVLIASPGAPRVMAAFAGGMSLVWAAVRAVSVHLVAPDLSAEKPAVMRGALGIGLLPYAAALTPETRLAAWALSAGITWLVATRSGLPKRRVLQAASVAWGAQAVVVLGAWLARNAFVAVLAARS